MIIISVTNGQMVKSFDYTDYQSLKFSSSEKFLVCQKPVDDLQILAFVIGGLEGETPKTDLRLNLVFGRFEGWRHIWLNCCCETAAQPKEIHHHGNDYTPVTPKPERFDVS
jgi:hypothetical protein